MDPAFWSAHAPAHLIIELTIDKRNRQRTDELFAAMARRGYRAERIQGLCSQALRHLEAVPKFGRAEAPDFYDRREEMAETLKNLRQRYAWRRNPTRKRRASSAGVEAAQ